MADPTQPGEIIAGKYRVERVLGRGGMGVVVSAVHLALDQQVAIKLLLEEIRSEDPTAEKRFDREARSAAQLRSEHVCRVVDAGFLEAGTPFLAMEYLEGVDLAEELGARGHVDAEEAARWVRQACEGVAEAHSLGIVHRDLKPANLFLAKRPDGGRILKVLDFGVSKSLAPTGPGDLSLTKTATLVGSPVYMSPEQLRSSKDVDARTDVWALGVILFELVAGRAPFEGENMVGLAHSIISDPHPRLADLGINVPDGFEEVMSRALAKLPEERYETAAELSMALRPFAPDPLVTGSGLASMASAALRASSFEDKRPSADPAPTPNGSHSGSVTGISTPTPRWVWWVASLVIVSAIALGLWLRQQRQAGPEANEAAREPRGEEAPPKPAAAGIAEDERAAKALASTPEAQAEPVEEAPAADEAEEAPTEEAPEPPKEIEEAMPESPATAEPERPRSRREAKKRRQRAAKEAASARSDGPEKPELEAPPAETDDDALPDFGGRR